MQMQAINPLIPVVPCAQETRPGDGENFIDSLRSVHSKADSIHNRKTGCKTKQDDDLASATPPEPGEVSGTPQKVAGEAGGHVAAVAEDKQRSTEEEEPSAITGSTAFGPTSPAAAQAQVMIDQPAGSFAEEVVLPDNQVNTFLPQAVAEHLGPKADQAPPQSADPNQTRTQPSTPPDSFEAARPGDGPPPSAVTVVETMTEPVAALFPQDAEIIQLQKQSALPQPFMQPATLSDRPVSVAADYLSGRDQKVLPLDSRFVELLQKTADSAPGQAATQVDTAADLTYTRFAEILGSATGQAATQGDPTTDLTYTRLAEILGHAAGPTAETVPDLVPIRQRYSWTAGRFAITTTPGHSAQETGAGLTVLNVSEQALAEGKGDGPGKDILWGQLASIDPSAPHHSGTEKTADFMNTFIPAQNTPANTVSSQDGSAPRLNQGIAVPEHGLVDNVIQQVSHRAGHEQSSSITIRLHPEELGHLKMDLLASNENIKAHIHVQSQLTQEILTKHLHRLREGFAQQGLVLDEIQVSVDSGTRSGHGFFNDQRTLHGRPHHANVSRTREVREPVMGRTMVAPFRADGSINLRI
jgi:hypothetical protein